MSNIRLAGHSPAGQAFLSGPWGHFASYRALLVVNICCRNVKNDRFVSIRCFVFQALKYAKSSFSAGAPGSLRSSRSPSRLGRGTLLAPRLSGPRMNSWASSVVGARLSGPWLVRNLYTWPCDQKGWTPCFRVTGNIVVTVWRRRRLGLEHWKPIELRSVQLCHMAWEDDCYAVFNMGVVVTAINHARRYAMSSRSGCTWQ